MTALSKEFPGRSEFPVEIPSQCRNCITIARAALTHMNLEGKIQRARKEDASGALVQRWVAQAAEVGDMSLAEATEFVESREAQLKSELKEKLANMERACDAQVSIAEYVIDHCERGVVKLASVTEGVAMEVEVCGSTKPEHVLGFDDAEIVRIHRQPVPSEVVG